MSDRNLVKEPCSGDYRARQGCGSVTITATGQHNTGGFHTYFERSLVDVFPPEFALFHDRPTGAVTQVISPFSVDVSFEAKGTVKSVTVHDATGPHEVQVE